MSGFDYLLIMLDSCEGVAMARSVSTGVFIFHKPGFDAGSVGHGSAPQHQRSKDPNFSVIRKADTKLHTLSAVSVAQRETSVRSTIMPRVKI
jgi:hypothetical protein